jgi:Protein of unknown function (DUF3551)
MRALIATLPLVAAALLTATPAAVAQANAPWCLTGTESGIPDCSFDTLAQCQQSLSAVAYSGTCTRNLQSGTTGMGSDGAREDRRSPGSLEQGEERRPRIPDENR